MDEASARASAVSARARLIVSSSVNGVYASTDAGATTATRAGVEPPWQSLVQVQYLVRPPRMPYWVQAAQARA